MKRLNPELRSFWKTPARNRVLYGGRSSSKSHDAAGMAIILASQYKLRILCTRHFQNKIAESVYTLLVQKIEDFELSQYFRITATSIVCVTTGSEFIFYGIALNIDQIRSTENIDILWLEEAHLLTKKQWSILEPTLRKQGSQAWVIFNPHFSSDFVYQRFVVNPPPNTIIRQINYDKNPFLSETMKDVIQAQKDEDLAEYEHVYLGMPKQDNDKALIKRSWIEASIDAHIVLGFEAAGQKVMGFDVADDGGDANANVYAHGAVAFWCEEFKGLEDKILQSCKRTYFNAQERGASIMYDCIGVGAFVGSKIDEINQENRNKVEYRKFNAGGGVVKPDAYYAKSAGAKIKNKDYFANAKAQAWWSVADRFRNTYDAMMNGTKYEADQLISISSEMDRAYLEKLKHELSTPRRDFDNNGRVKVESKKDLAARSVASPNLADAFIMCFVPVTKFNLLDLL